LEAFSVKRKLVVFALGILFVGLISGGTATAQTKAYRQVGLASDAPELASTVDPQMKNSWGITFLPGQPFFISNNGSGSITVHDATGVSAGAGFIVPDLAGTGPGTPTGIVADVNSEFAGRNFVQPFIVVTDDGRVFEWGPDARGDIPQQPTLVFDSSPAGAVYKGVTILHSQSSAPAVAVTDFHGGFIQTFLPGFAPVALAGSFSDANLPAGYAPFGIQVIGSQVFVTYAVQDIAKHDPVIGAGNGIVSIFDMDGNFLKRFATGGPLNAPLGVTQASANFGPFSNTILIANAGDGIINAFDPGTGNFLGALKDGDGIAITDLSLHALTFRSDSFGDPNTLYLTAEIGVVRLAFLERLPRAWSPQRMCPCRLPLQLELRCLRQLWRQGRATLACRRALWI
jgi:uncharacterized protein (TIGR03118 family)